jgi:hypothetical protein
MYSWEDRRKKMNDKTQRAVISWVKYLAWTGVAALIQAAIENVGNMQLPVWFTPILGSVLKAAATFVATQVVQPKEE